MVGMFILSLGGYDALEEAAQCLPLCNIIFLGLFTNECLSSCLPGFVQVQLPDVEFFVNLGDWPLEKRKPTEKIHPIFSWCGSNNTMDIVMPTYDLTESVLETMGRYSLVLHSHRSSANITLCSCAIVTLYDTHKGKLNETHQTIFFFFLLLPDTKGKQQKIGFLLALGIWFHIHFNIIKNGRLQVNQLW